MNPIKITQRITSFCLQRTQFFSFISIVSICTLVTGCAEPFEIDRHTMGDFRILSARVTNGVADAVIWSGEGAYHTNSPQLRWYHSGELLGEGFGISLPEKNDYQLEVESSDGTVLYAEVEIGSSISNLSLQREHWFPEEDGYASSFRKPAGIGLVLANT